MKKESSPLKKRNPTPKATDTATVEESIRPYAIADKLRTLRLRRSMGLAQLAEHSGFSPAMLVAPRKWQAGADFTNTYAHCIGLRRWTRLLLQ